MSRWENAPTLREVIRLMGVMIDLYCASYATPPVAVTLDIDDTLDVVHGHQQLSLFNAHYDERYFLPIHVYDVATSRPLAVLLRPGKTPSGQEVTGHLRRLVRRIRRHWPTTRITLRGDSHYGRPEVMDFCEQKRHRLCVRAFRQRHARSCRRDHRRRYPHPPCARAGARAARLCRDDVSGQVMVEAAARLCPHRGHIPRPRHPLRRHQPRRRFGRAHIRHHLLCARPGREPDQDAQGSARLRTSCRSPLANQMRLILHTAAYWLMLTLRDAIPKAHALAKAEFATIRLRLIKLGAPVIETASRIRLAFAAACPEAALIMHLATTISPAGPRKPGPSPPRRTILETHNASQKSDPQRAENDATVIRVLEKSAVDTSPMVNRCG